MTTERHFARWMASTALFTGALAGCASAPAPIAAPTVPLPPTLQPSVADRLLLDVAVAQACPRLRGRFLSLPDEEDAQRAGAGVGMAATGGRWLVEECEASSANGALSLRLGGPGWTWVEQTHYGNRVRQHVYFAATVDLVGSLQLGYDPRTLIANVFMLPRAKANVIPALQVHAEPVTLFGRLLDLVVDEDKHARDAVQSEGSQEFTEDLNRGLTVTFDVARAQPDVSLGRLPPGVVPLRPFRGSDPWFVNERQALHPGGFLVAGPFPPGVPTLVDLFNEGGGSALYRTACSDVVVSEIHGFFGGLAFTPIAPVSVSGSVAPGQRTASLAVPPQSCAWVLLTASASGNPTSPPVYVAIEVRPTH